MKGDLHCHTRISDGSLGIEDVITLAKRCDLDFISITDHDSMAGLIRANVLGERHGINIINGVEISAYDNKRNRKVHILCYMPDKPNRLEGLIYKTNENRKKAGEQMAKNVMDIYPILPEHILKYSGGAKAIYKQHIMNALMDFGFTSSIFSPLYKALFDEDRGTCDVPIKYPDVFDAINMIKLAGGIAILAHPRVHDSFDLFDELATKGLINGAEAFSPKNKKEDTKRILETCDKFNLIPTGGSDFHGLYNSAQATIGSFTTSEESINALFALKRK